MTAEQLGRAVIADTVVPVRILIEGETIAAIAPDPAGEAGPHLVPGFIDLHVHGWGGHDAMAGADALAGMAGALLARGVTAFLPTAVSAPLDELRRFADAVRGHMADRVVGGAVPLGFNLEGPFLAPGRRGAHAADHLRRPADVPVSDIEPLIDGLRLITVAPELDGAAELIAWLVKRGVTVSLGHSESTLAEARSGYAAGARSTTHLFNAMTGLDHRAPGLAAAALDDDRVAVELIADGHHVHRTLWRTVVRTKPADRLLLVTDAISLAGTGDGRGRIGGLEIEVRAGRSTLVGTSRLAGSVIGLDEAVRNLVAAGTPLPAAVAAASTNPARLLGLRDRGEIAVGRRADLVELDDELRLTGVLLGGARVA